MGQALILEMTFLIDLERELAQASGGRAQEFPEAHPSDRLFITPTIAGELAAGQSLEGRGRWEEFIAPFHVLAHTRDVSWEYGCAYRYLQANGRRIGGNDLWIAAIGGIEGDLLLGPPSGALTPPFHAGVQIRLP